MTAIFISHSSKDATAAETLKGWLMAQGYTSLFLDFDPEVGITAGSNWEQTLYRKLRQCQAVIALLTPHWLASKWCFAELVQARVHGKAIFPVQVQSCDAGSIFADIQHIDLTTCQDQGYQRLADGLKARGLDPLHMFDWDLDRPPYPGLMAFQEEDAAIFFGRDEEIAHGLETLNGLWRLGREAPRCVLFLGASGSGKSSLVRAGLLPRLKKDPAHWLPVRPFRPQDNPLDELALALADTFGALNHPRSWDEIRAMLMEAAAQNPADGRALLMLVRDLLMTAKRRDATMLLTIDQAEELFGTSHADAAARFLRLLRAALEAADQQLMVLATMRSDFLSQFQIHPGLHDQAYARSFAYQPVTIAPVALDSVRKVITGPARLAGLRLEDGLVEALVRDTGTRDALPLLAFTLRRLYERYGADGLLEMHEYEKLGGLEGAIRQEADRVLRATNPSTEELAELRAAFVPTMVHINADGAYTRRRAYRDEMACRAALLLNRFVDARLLVTDCDNEGRETLEVAHEALLRTWPQLHAWLAEDQDKLRLLESIHRAAQEWDKGGQRDDLLMHRAGRLADVEALVHEPRFTPAGGSVDRAYIQAGIALRNREQAEEEHRKQEKEAADRERLQLAEEARLKADQLAEEQHLRAEEQTQRAEEAERLRQEAEIAQAQADREALGSASRELAVASIANLTRDPELSILLALEALSKAMTAEAKDALHQALPASRVRATFACPGGLLDSIAYSPDGINVATAAADGTVTLWNVFSGLPERTWKAHTNAVTGVTFSADGMRLATASLDQTACIWDPTAPEDPFVVLPHADRVNGVAFNREGTRLATAVEDGTALVWNVAKGQIEQSFAGHTRGVNQVAFNPEGTRLATAGEDHIAILWDLETSAPVRKLIGHLDRVHGVAFSPDGARLATASYDSTLRLWDTTSGESIVMSRQKKGWVRTVAYSADGTRLASGGYDNTAKIYDAETCSVLIDLSGHARAVHSVAFSPDGSWLVTASLDGTARIWDISSKEETFTLQSHTSAVAGIAYSPDGARIATVSNDTSLKLWNSISGQCQRTIPAHRDAVTSVAFSPDGKRLATAAWDNEAKIWDAASGALLFPPFSHEKAIIAVAFSPDGRRLATACWDETTHVWDIASGELLFTLPHNAEVNGVAFSRDGRHIVTGSDDKTAKVWHAVTGKLEHTLKGHTDWVFGVAFSRDGKWIATASNDYTVGIWHADTGALKVFLTGHTSWVRAVAFSPDSRRVATACADRTVKVWDVESGDPQLALLGHGDEVWGVAFSPDGKRLATGCFDKTARVWDAVSGQELFTLSDNTSAIGQEVFSPDEGVRLYRIPIEDLIELGQRRITRQLTEAERRKYLHEVRQQV